MIMRRARRPRSEQDEDHEPTYLEGRRNAAER